MDKGKLIRKSTLQ